MKKLILEFCKAATTVPLFIEFSNIDFSFSLSGTYNFTEFRK